jgi:hypothetical protein
MIPSGAHEHLTAPQVADIVSESCSGQSERERRRSHEAREATSRLTARGVRVPGIIECRPGCSIT